MIIHLISMRLVKSISILYILTLLGTNRRAREKISTLITPKPEVTSVTCAPSEGTVLCLLQCARAPRATAPPAAAEEADRAHTHTWHIFFLWIFLFLLLKKEHFITVPQLHREVVGCRKNRWCLCKRRFLRLFIFMYYIIIYYTIIFI